jgi:hypothetical protein
MLLDCFPTTAALHRRYEMRNISAVVTPKEPATSKFQPALWVPVRHCEAEFRSPQAYQHAATAQEKKEQPTAPEKHQQAAIMPVQNNETLRTERKFIIYTARMAGK